MYFQWGGNKSLLAVNSGETVIILNEQVMNAHYNHEVSDQLLWMYVGTPLTMGRILARIWNVGLLGAILGDCFCDFP